MREDTINMFRRSNDSHSAIENSSGESSNEMSISYNKCVGTDSSFGLSWLIADYEL